MRVVSLGSGSSGNALFIEAGPQGRTKLLVDAGLSGRVLTERLRKLHASPSELQGVLLTHEHSDHTIGVATLTKRYGIPVIADPQTYDAVQASSRSGMWRTDSGNLTLNVASIEAEPFVLSNEGTMLALPVGSRRSVGDIEITSFPISHDAIAPCGYLLKAGGCRVCIVTDSGEVTPAMLDVMQHADLLILESNHDRDRLIRGPYPQHLKKRILSPTGHLSNEQAAEAVLRTWQPDGVRWLWLAHISKTNNTPSLALNSMRTRLQAANANLSQIHISVSPPDMGHVWDSTQLWQASSLWEMKH
ncbi:MAG: MBL fold metallo-hydrolase [Ktedonobacteraceae bacterium]